MDPALPIRGRDKPGEDMEQSRASLNAGQLQALIHLYRAEVGRMVAYRQRLDTATNWAITSVAAVTTLSLGSSAIPPEAFLVLMLINLFFLVLEARRFKAYEIARYRVLLLEHHFYPEVLVGPDETSGDWRRALVEAMRMPNANPHVGSLSALGWRARRNYVWIYLAILVTWVAKLEITVRGGGATDVISAAAIGPIPGPIVWTLVAVGYALLIGVAVLARRTYPTGSETTQALLKQEPD